MLQAKERACAAGSRTELGGKNEGREAADRLQGKYGQARLNKRLRRLPLSLRVVEATAEF